MESPKYFNQNDIDWDQQELEWDDVEWTLDYIEHDMRNNEDLSVTDCLFCYFSDDYYIPDDVVQRVIKSVTSRTK